MEGGREGEEKMGGKGREGEGATSFLQTDRHHYQLEYKCRG